MNLDSYLDYQYNDGGRKAAGYKGKTRDCVTRSIAIVTGMPYQEVYDLILKYAEKERPHARRRRSHPRTGVHRSTTRKIMADLGWAWTPTMGIGTGCRVHMRADELPSGTLMVQLSRHCSVVIDGVIHDSDSPDREGTRCVYGYYWKEEEGGRRYELLG